MNDSILLERLKLFGVKLAAIFRGQAEEVTSGSNSRSITFMQFGQRSVLLTYLSRS